VLANSIEQPLYHYTGVNSLLGIARTKSLWASNVFYLNDSSEIVHACKVLEEVLLPRFAFGKPTSPEYEFQRQFREWVGTCKTTPYNVFVFSLSEQPSLLSQWRSYTPHGKGVSVGFSEGTIKSLSELSDLRIAKCLYKAADQESVLRTLLDELLTTFQRERSNIDTTQAHPTQCYHPFLEERFRGDVLQVLSIIKHPAFEEEREWRLISPYYARYTVPAIKFREGASMLVPYIELPLGEVKPYFSSVILGPSQHEHLSMSALSMFLSNQGLCNVTSNSVIPYREW